jgi:transcriptional regulator with PAS, ATPase and Fis domain
MWLAGDSRFDEVHALSIWDEHQTQKCRDIYEQRVTIHPVTMQDQFSFEEAFAAANGFLESKLGKGDELSLFLTPGTHAMVASLLLLGKTRFPAKFLRYDNAARAVVEENIPFDLVMGSVGDRLRIPDANLQGFLPFTQELPTAFKSLAGSSRQFMEAVALAERAGKRDVDVLILGESGTGKELFAGGIHMASRRGIGGKPFVPINCAAIPESLFESELFGSLPGAFTDAKKKRPGAFERADGGTLFLDEVGELSPANQAKLLRALQPLTAEGPCVRLIQPVGMAKESDQVKVDVRVIAATNRDLMERVHEGAFREDLLYRLGAVKITLPPLRGRPTDIESIAKALLDRINGHFQQHEPGYQPKRLTPDAVVALCRRRWPGNIRELEAMLKQISVFLDGEEITATAIEHLAPELPDPTTSMDLLYRAPEVRIDLPQRLREIQAHFVSEAIREAGSQKAAAQLLNISQQQISKVLKEAENQATGAASEDEGKPGKS